MKCVITDDISYIVAENINWNHRANWMGSVFVIQFIEKEDPVKCKVIAVEEDQTGLIILRVDSLKNYLPLKMAVLMASHKGPAEPVEFLRIYVE